MYGGRRLLTAQGEGYRPATQRVREALFSMLESRGVRWEGLRVLDLFAGSGSLGFEAVSRGAVEAWFVEQNPAACAVLRKNIDQLGIDQGVCRIVCASCARVLQKRPDAAFNVAFVDPPYGTGLAEPTLRLATEHGWLGPGGIAILETEPSAQVAWAVEQLEPVADRSYGQTRIRIWQNIKNA